MIADDARIEATLEEVVVYQSQLDHKIWIRPKAEFFDGRFTTLEERPQIDMVKAVQFSLEKIESLEERSTFLQDCLESDMFTIGEAGWLGFTEYCK